MKHLIAVTDDEMELLSRALATAAASASDTEMVALGNSLVARASKCESLVTALTGASHALRSYQYGNSSTELAEEIADACDEALIYVGRPPAGPIKAEGDGGFERVSV